MDMPKSLKDVTERENRLRRIYENHMNPLTLFVNMIRAEKGRNYSIPYFDPEDGGINAKFLFLLEAPGPNAVRSGFISRNNPDETAKNMMEILKDVGIPRKQTVLWNIVPWYIGNEQKIRPAKYQDIFQGWQYFKRLMMLLPNIKTIILMGRKAQKIKNALYDDYPNIAVVECFHPSPMFIHRNINNRSILMEQLKELKEGKKEFG